MKKYVWSETNVEGGARFTGKLTDPPSATGPFQALKRKASNHVPVELTHDVYKDAVVVAFPTPAAASAQVVPKVTSNSPQFDSSLVTGYGVSMPAALSTENGEPLLIQAAYSTSVSVHAVTLGLAAAADVEIQAAASDGTLGRRTSNSGRSVGTAGIGEYFLVPRREDDDTQDRPYAGRAPAAPGHAEGQQAAETEECVVD